MVCFQSKNPNLRKFFRVSDWKMLIYLVAVWNILWPFGMLCDHSVQIVLIWYIFSFFGIMHQEKSGNPARKRRGLTSVTKSLLRQGDQIGRSFAKWVIVYFGQLLENYGRIPHFGATLFHGYVYSLIFTKYGLDYIFGDFSQTHLVTLLLPSKKPGNNPTTTEGSFLRRLGANFAPTVSA
jgi:hypothetical protein